MKQWQRRIKIKQHEFHPCFLWMLPCRNAQERRYAEIAKRVWRKKTFWPDRLIPLTDEEKAYVAERDAARPTLEQLNKVLDEINLHDSYRPITLVSEKFLKQFYKEIDEQWLNYLRK